MVTAPWLGEENWVREGGRAGSLGGDVRELRGMSVLLLLLFHHCYPQSGGFLLIDEYTALQHGINRHDKYFSLERTHGGEISSNRAESMRLWRGHHLAHLQEVHSFHIVHINCPKPHGDDVSPELLD